MRQTPADASFPGAACPGSGSPRSVAAAATLFLLARAAAFRRHPICRVAGQATCLVAFGAASGPAVATAFADRLANPFAADLAPRVVAGRRCRDRRGNDRWGRFRAERRADHIAARGRCGLAAATDRGIAGGVELRRRRRYFARLHRRPAFALTWRRCLDVASRAVFLRGQRHTAAAAHFDAWRLPIRPRHWWRSARRPHAPSGAFVISPTGAFVVASATAFVIVLRRGAGPVGPP